MNWATDDGEEKANQNKGCCRKCRYPFSKEQNTDETSAACTVCMCHSQPQEEENYSQHDHVHCWESKKPPCGQKIEHLKCCLCEKLNPKIHTLLTAEREKGMKEGREQYTGYAFQEGHKQALQRVREIISRKRKMY